MAVVFVVAVLCSLFSCFTTQMTYNPSLCKDWTSTGCPEISELSRKMDEVKENLACGQETSKTSVTPTLEDICAGCQQISEVSWKIINEVKQALNATQLGIIIYRLHSFSFVLLFQVNFYCIIYVH